MTGGLGALDDESSHHIRDATGGLNDLHMLKVVHDKKEEKYLKKHPKKVSEEPVEDTLKSMGVTKEEVMSDP